MRKLTVLLCLLAMLVMPVQAEPAVSPVRDSAAVLQPPPWPTPVPFRRVYAATGLAAVDAPISGGATLLPTLSVC